MRAVLSLCLTLVLSSGSHAAIMSKRVAVSASLPSGWTYQGCFTDSVSQRQLSGASYHDTSGMTEESCINYCNSRGYLVAGLEYAQECYCDLQLGSGSQQKPDADCSMSCTGDASEACGAGDRLSVFMTDNKGTPSVIPAGWASQGCYTDNVSARTLTSAQDVPGGGSAMTVEKCVNACRAAGYSVAGVEYSQECWCGNQVANGGTPATSGCSMPCKGNTAETCGGPDRLNVYAQVATSTTISSTSVMTTATTTTTTITTTAGVTSTTTTTTTTSSSGPSCAATRGSGYLQNGGFEQDFTYWSGGSGSYSFSSRVVSDGHSLEGCSAFELYPASTGSSGFKQFSFGQSLRSPSSGGYVSFYVGRRNNTYIPNDENPVIGVSYNGQRLARFSACSSTGCNIQGQGGSVWSFLSISIPLSQVAQSGTLSFTITWQSSIGPNAPVLFDGFSVT